MTEQTRQLPDNAKSSDDEMTLAEATQILVYQDAALPVSEHLATAATSQAAFIQKLPEGNWTIGNGSGPVTQETPSERKERIEHEQLEAMRDGLEDTQRQLKEEREREEWSQSTHSYAGVEMTGEEWGELADELTKKDSKLGRWLRDKMKKDGVKDPDKMVDQVALRMRMQNLPPSQWTDDMKALDAIMKADPELDAKIKGYTNAAATHENPDVKRAVDQTTEAGSHSASTESGADFYNSVTSAPAAKGSPGNPSLRSAAKDFPSAPDLGEHYGQALAATQPLDAKMPKLQVAAAATTVAPASPGGGFDV